MVKLGVFNDDLHTNFAGAAELAADACVDGLAVRYVEGINVADMEAADVGELHRIAEANGLEIASIGSQFGRGFYPNDDAAREHAEAHLQRALECAEICETRLVRAFPGWLRGQEPLTEWRRRPAYPDCLDMLVDLLTPAVRMAERAGATLMLELEGASYVGTIEEARAFLEAMNSPALAVCWDVCNGWWSGELPREGLARLEGLPLVDVQTKDVPAEPDDPETASLGRAVVGDGDVGYPWLLPELVRRGYDGYITAERVHHPIKPEVDHGAQQATLQDIAALKRILGAEGGALQ